MEPKNSVYPTLPDPTMMPPPPPSYVSVMTGGDPVSIQQQQFNSGFPAQQPVYVQSSLPTNTVIIQPQRWYPLSKQPVSMNCPQCNARIVTRVTKQTGGGTWLISGGVCLAGCVFPILWLGCCLLPFCIDDCKDSVHHCSNCNAYIGTHTL